MFSEWSIGQFRFQISLQSKKYFSHKQKTHNNSFLCRSQICNHQSDNECEFHVSIKKNF